MCMMMKATGKANADNCDDASQCTIGQGAQQGTEKYKKWAKVDTCFSYSK